MYFKILFFVNCVAKISIKIVNCDLKGGKDSEKCFSRRLAGYRGRFLFLSCVAQSAVRRVAYFIYFFPSRGQEINKESSDEAEQNPPHHFPAGVVASWAGDLLSWKMYQVFCHWNVIFIYRSHCYESKQCFCTWADCDEVFSCNCCTNVWIHWLV